jgi:predicted transposase YdaD
MANHDNGYKLLFSHASVVADVLLGFVKEKWVQEVDFKTLERVEGSYVSDRLRSRESDMVWKVRWKDRFLYVYILLEFQSKVDPFIAVRVMTYLGLLWRISGSRWAGWRPICRWTTGCGSRCTPG